MADTRPLTTAHWGTYRAEVRDGRLVGLHPFEQDPDPSPIGRGIIEALDAPTRITGPMVRESWLKGGPGTATGQRGQDAFVEVSWDEVIPRVAAEVVRVRDTHGPAAIYAGSYGWASAGRFHHAQSQLKRFLTLAGGFTRSIGTYSFAAAEMIVPHVLGSFRASLTSGISWRSIAEAGQLVVAFGGMPLKNGQVDSGGMGAHVQRAGMQAARDAGVELVSVSPIQDDSDGAEWLSIPPGSDVALMLGLAHTLVAEGLHDVAFLESHCSGFERFRPYLMGESDAQPKHAEWAEAICGLPAETIRTLARRMAGQRTVISLGWSLTRADHGEQPYWMGITLAAMLGQIGLPGGGVAFGLSASNSIGGDYTPTQSTAFPLGQNPINSAIPVARLTEMLERPGAEYRFDGQTRRYPETRLIWWAGGNPFHHHQDLNRLARAWARPDTVIINDWCWTATARRADIVLPVTTHLERSDIAMAGRDPYVIATEQVLPPPAGVRNDHEIFAALAAELGFGAAFTEGRSEAQWQRHLYDSTRAHHPELPDYDTLRATGWARTTPPEQAVSTLQAFRGGAALDTPTGKIEIFSEVIAGYHEALCPGYPVWHPPSEGALTAAPDELHLISNQPSNKLHSQLDQGGEARADKRAEREQVTLHPDDASSRGIGAGDMIELYNRRGCCLGTARLSAGIRRGVVQMATGAWWDPDEGGRCRHGNPNALTRDIGTSPLGQGPTAHSCLVRIRKVNDTPDLKVRAFEPPHIMRKG